MCKIVTMHPPRPPTDTTDPPADARDPAAGEPHAQAGVGGAPNGCPICGRTTGHEVNRHLFYAVGFFESALEGIAKGMSTADACTRAQMALERIGQDPIVGRLR